MAENILDERPDAERKVLGVGLPAVGWALAEAGRIPYVALISISVFVPYFATQVVGDPVRGQAIVAVMGTIAGLIAGFTAPLLGATLDALGPRKPWIALGTALQAVLLCTLWWALPNGAGLSVPALVIALALIKVLYAYTEVLHNSMMPFQADRRTIHRVSALGMAVGSLSGVLIMSFVLIAFSLPGRVDWSWVPTVPLFGLDQSRFEQARITGPLAGGLLFLAILPLLWLAKDAPKAQTRFLDAIGHGARYLVHLPTKLKGNRDGALFLIFRMIFADGAVALVIFGGVYAAGVMHWGGVQLLIIGIMRMFCAALGSMVAGWLDGRFGCKRAVQIQLFGMILLVIAMIGTTPTQILYFWSYTGPGAVDNALFSGPPEWVFLGIVVAIAFVSLGLQSSSRSFLSRISPPDQTGAYFGLYALTGSATSWLGPLAVGLATEYFGTQQAGMVPIVAFLIVGLAGLFLIRSRVDGSD
ncbi:MFS transporter [Sphingopyxis lindanitolerans]|nr:MFS transporter [Sphingopyxis lindanitolerans]